MRNSGVSRREFLALSAGGVAALSGINALPAATIGSQLARVLADTIAVDMHSHVGIPFDTSGAPLPHFDLAGEMKRAGLSAVIQTYELDSVEAAPGEDYLHNRRALDFEDRLLAAAGVRRALTLADLATAHATRQPVVIQSAEGAQFLEGKIERLDEAYRRGLRVLQPVHQRDDSVRPLADLYTGDAHLGGLTDFGAEVIRAANRLGLVIDLTHMSYEAVRAALRISGDPMLFSHTSLQPGPRDPPAAAGMLPRLLSEQEARDIANGGGVIGVWTRGADTVSQYVTSIKRLVDVVGIDHVGIGTDSDLEPAVQRDHTNALWKNEKRNFFPAVAEEMLLAGFAPVEVGKVGGGNFCRVFGRVTQ